MKSTANNKLVFTRINVVFDYSLYLLAIGIDYQQLFKDPNYLE